MKFLVLNLDLLFLGLRLIFIKITDSLSINIAVVDIFLKFCSVFLSFLISDFSTIKKYDALILPGVGSFPEAMKKLNKIRARENILNFVKTKKLLGICLGMQLLVDKGEEIKPTKGLGLIPGKVVRFPKTV